MQLIADRYEPLELIASGGMATVWRARDHRLDRLVALKRPHPGLADEAAWRRMDREARAAAALSHPNLVTIYDYGSDEDGPYLVMELLDGPTLQEVSGDIDLERVIGVGAQLADGLAAIHAAGIVHRDVKPANVVMSPHGPQLTDFGIATDPGNSAAITDPGQVVATPAYAAPEVLRGDEPSPASDVFSLAVVVEELAAAGLGRVDTELRSVLESARSPAPEDRPSAERFAEALCGVTPTVARPVAAEGSTLVLETSAVARDDADDIAGESRGVSPWTAGLLGAFALVGVLITLGLTLASDDSDADALGPPGAIVSTTTSSANTTTSPVVTSTSLGMTTTVAPEIDDLQMARQELEAALLEPPRSDLSRSEAEDLMKKVDEAIVLAGQGDDRDAEKKLSEVAKRIEQRLDEDGDAAVDVLNELATLLGLDLDRRDDDRDDD